MRSQRPQTSGDARYHQQRATGSRYGVRGDPTGITDYLKSDGSSLAKACEMAKHADTRTTQFYDRRADVASLDEFGKVGI